MSNTSNEAAPISSRTSTPDRPELKGDIAGGEPNVDQQQLISDSIRTIPERIIQVIIPVTIGCLYTCTLIRLLALSSDHGKQILGNTFNQIGVDFGPDGQPSISTILTIVFAVCGVIIVLTLIILIIFYLEWHKCLAYYLYVPCLITFVAITPMIIHNILRAFNSLTIDIFTMTIFIWNFTIFGVVSVFGLLGIYSPLISQQFFLIHNSSMLSILMIEMLPSWAPWLLLVFMILWDLFAVLAPFGPLNLILNMAEKRGLVEMPGIVYSTQAAVPPNQDTKLVQKQEQDKKEIEQRIHFKELKVENQVPVDAPDAPCGLDPSSPASGAGAQDEEAPNSPQPPPTINSDAEPQVEDKPKSPSPAKPSNPADGQEVDVYEEEGTSIGIGDFVFYSLLVGLTSKDAELQDYYTPLATLLAVLFGLVLTLSILALTNRPLPAVPISVSLGITVAYLTTIHVPEFANRLACRNIFI